MMRCMLASVLVLFLTACGSASGGAPSDNASAVVAIHEEPTRLNPILGPAMSYATMVESPMFPNLFRILPNGSLRPDLAAVVPTVANGGISKDGLTYTFHLRHGVKWSDGAAFGAADVIATYRLITNPNVQAVTTDGYSLVKTAAIVNPFTVRFTLKTPYAPFLAGCWSNALTGILPAHVFAGVSNVNTAPYNQAPTVTLGPFKFASWERGGAITLDANPLYYGPKPKLRHIVFQVMPDQNTILTALQAGSVNLAQLGPLQVRDVLNTPHIDLHVFGHPSWEVAALNEHDPILADARVRRALEYGIDRAAIVEHVMRGYAELIGDSFPPSSWAHDAAILPYPYDPKKAAALLEQAGWKVGPGGVRVKNGVRLELTYSTTSGNPVREETEQIMQAQLAKIGVRLNISNYPADVLFGDHLFHQTFQIVEFQPTGGPDPDTRAYQADSCKAIPPTGANYGSWCDPRIDPLFVQEQRATDRAARKAAFTRIARIENQEMPYLYLFSQKAVVATRGLDGYVSNPYAPATWNSEAWSVR